MPFSSMPSSYGPHGSEYYKWHANYTTCHDAEDATGWGGNFPGYFRVGQLWDQSFMGGVYIIYRAALYCSGGAFADIDPDDIVGAYIKLYPNSNTDIKGGEDFDLTIIGCDGIPLTARAASDYGALGDNETDFGHMNTDDLDIGEWNEITLNGDGVEHIRTWRRDHPGRGWMWIGLRSADDIDEDAYDADGDHYEVLNFTQTASIRATLYLWYLGGACWAAGAVRTDEATSITTTTATINGTLVNAGGETCACGFMWGTTVDCSDETTDSEAVEEDGAFSHGLTGLTTGTLYYFKTYATNSQGTCYGDVLSFRAPLAFPTDNRARVSSIRRIYRPGLYRMEVSLGDLGFDVDVVEAAMRKVTEGVAEPEEGEPVEKKKVPTPEEVAEAAERFKEVSWSEAMESAGMMAGTERPTVSGKWTAPAPGPPTIPGLNNYVITYPDGRKVIVAAKNTTDAATVAGVPIWQRGLVNIRKM